MMNERRSRERERESKLWPKNIFFSKKTKEKQKKNRNGGAAPHESFDVEATCRYDLVDL